LFDRLEARGLIMRNRASTDRRVVKTAITEEGLKILKELDRPVMELHERQLGKMGEKKLKALIELLEDARANAE
jgi:DNA-binding MarR family transcriptional regulator